VILSHSGIWWLIFAPFALVGLGIMLASAWIVVRALFDARRDASASRRVEELIRERDRDLDPAPDLDKSVHRHGD
jgi:hypothetical protein